MTPSLTARRTAPRRRTQRHASRACCAKAVGTDVAHARIR